MSLAPGTTIGPYEILEPIGSGGMGVVYRAADTKLGRDVALKLLPEEFANDPERMARFHREARVLASLNHPNIAAIYGLEESGRRRALVMELVEGPTLAERIAQTPLPIEEVLSIAKQIADALEYAHEQGVIHRDLKPANIKIKADGQVKVLDFGLAKAFSDETHSDTASNSPTLSLAATQAGVVLGTAAYMSPEQAKGKTVDRRADIWAFGIVVFEMLTSRRVFAGETAPETMAQVMLKEPEWDALPANTPSQLRNLLRRCLTREPRSRLQSMGDARIEIEQIASDLSNAPAPTAAVPGKPHRRRELVLGAIAFLFFASTVALSLRAWFASTPKSPLVRFEVFAPEGVRIRPSAFEPVSPDGRKIAFIAGEGSTSMIWIRPVESSTAQAIPGTEGVGRFFWSPDSQYLAFTTADKTQKVAVSGGSPQILWNRPGRDLAWSAQGVILIGGNGPLLRLSAAGGQPIPETELDASRKEVTHDYPYFLPDGRHYLYLVRSRDGQDQTFVVYVGELGSKERRALPGLTTDTRYSTSGHVIFLREGMLMAQPFDIRRLELAGEPFPITETFANAGQITGAYSVSLNGGVAYLPNDSASNTRLVWFDRSGKEISQEPVSGFLQAPNLSRDGKRVVYEKGASGGKNDVWALDLSRGIDMRLTFDGNSGRPVFSPDGSKVVFGRPTGGGPGSAFYQKSTSGTGPEERLEAGEPTDWSPDGDHILYIRAGDLWALSLKDRTSIVVATGKGNDRRGRFSPDGKWMAYESDESGRFEIYVQSFPPAGDRLQVSSNGGGSAWWRSDGRELFYYSALDQKLVSLEIKLGKSFEPGAPHELFQIPGVIANGRFIAANDGQRFLLPLVSQSATRPLTVILNWGASLAAR